MNALRDRAFNEPQYPSVSRRGYLDWLRGVAVLIMVEAHLFDAWVRISERSERPYQWAIAIGGYSAPLFLFLAGVVMALGISSRLREGLTSSEAATIARRRGWQILGLAVLFRLQSFIISGGPFPQTLMKVDILNVMGLSMVLAAVLWRIGSRDIWRATALIRRRVVLRPRHSRGSGLTAVASLPVSDSVVFQSRPWFWSVHALSVGWISPLRRRHRAVARSGPH